MKNPEKHVILGARQVYVSRKAYDYFLYTNDDMIRKLARTPHTWNLFGMVFKEGREFYNEVLAQLSI